MWNPLKPKQGVPLRLFGPGILEIEGQRVALLVCYEQLLTWPILASALEHPTLIVWLAIYHSLPWRESRNCKRCQVVFLRVAAPNRTFQQGRRTLLSPREPPDPYNRSPLV